MNITFVISSLQAGGAERAVSELANYWIQKKYDVSIVIIGKDKEPPFYLLDPNINLVYCSKCVHQLSLPVMRPYNVLRRILFLRKFLKKTKPDTIISFIDLTNIITLFAAKGIKIPIIVSERTDPFQHQLPKLAQWLRLKTYSWASRLVVQNKEISTYFPKSFQKFSRIIPNAIKSFPKKASLNEKVRKIITVGRLDKNKDHQTILSSFSNVISLISTPLTLTIYGEGPERSNLQNFINEKDLQDKVFLPGLSKNIQDALRESDLFIFSTLYEGFPNALGEAMAAGLPVIVSNCKGNLNIVNDRIDARVFQMKDVEQLTNLTIELINDFEQRKQIASNAAQVIKEKFNPERVFLLWDGLIEEVIKENIA